MVISVDNGQKLNVIYFRVLLVSKATITRYHKARVQVTEAYFLSVLEVRGLKTSCHQGPVV